MDLGALAVEIARLPRDVDPYRYAADAIADQVLPRQSGSSFAIQIGASERSTTMLTSLSPSQAPSTASRGSPPSSLSS